MKLENDVVREILLAIEINDEDPRGWVELSIPGRTPQQVAYHVQLLAEAGFIEAQDLSSSNIYDWRAKRLTFQGHEFLNTIRDPEIWRRTKEGASKIGGASIELLFTLGRTYLKQLMQEKLGIPLP